MKILKLYLSLIKLVMKSKVEYPFAFIVEILGGVINIGSFYVFVHVIFSKVSTINGWTYSEVLFLISLNWLCNALSGFFFYAPSKLLGEYIRNGTFDTFLIRPIRPLTYIIIRQFQYTFVGRLSLSIGFLIFSIHQLSIQWTFFKIVYFTAVIISGTLIHGAILLIFSASAFWVVNNDSIVDFVISYDGIRTLIDFPLNAFSKIIQLLFTFVLPFGFVNYYPATYFLNKSTGDFFTSPYLQFGAPAAGTLLFLCAIFVWNLGVKKYDSVGN